MELIGKLLVNTPVKRDRETLPDRFSWGRLKRRSGAPVLELNTLVAGMRRHRQHSGHTNKPAGYNAHKRLLSLVTACDRRDIGDGESLAASSIESGVFNRASGRKVPAPFSASDPSVVVAAISTCGHSSRDAVAGSPRKHGPEAGRTVAWPPCVNRRSSRAYVSSATTCLRAWEYSKGARAEGHGLVKREKARTASVIFERREATD